VRLSAPICQIMAFPAAEQFFAGRRVKDSNAAFARITVSNYRAAKPASYSPEMTACHRYLNDLPLDSCWVAWRGCHPMIKMHRERPGAIWKHAKGDARNRRAAAIVPGESAQRSGIGVEHAGSNEVPDIERAALFDG
jgi:hypothetical protein